MKRSWEGVRAWVGAALLASSCYGCAIFTIDAIEESESRTRKNAFLMTFNASQEIRKEAALPLLDWCSECYRFDRKWALSDPRCVDRIRRFEAGDTTALRRPTILPR